MREIWFWAAYLQYKRTGRWEAHIWDRLGTTSSGLKVGKQVHVGSFFEPHLAGRAYDRAAIKMRGSNAELNFPLSDYAVDPFMIVRTIHTA